MKASKMAIGGSVTLSVNGYVYLLLGMAISVLPPSISYTISLIAVLFFLIFKSGNYVHRLLALLLPFLLIITIGSINYSDSNAYDYIKDFWYLSKILIMFSLGYYVGMCMDDLSDLVIGLVTLSLLLFLLHISIALYYHFNGYSLTDVRSLGVLGYIIGFVGLGILFDKNIRVKYGIGNLYYVLILICGFTSLLLSFSRTNAVVMLLVTLILISRRNINYLAYGFFIIAAVLIATVISYYGLLGADGFDFFDKFSRSFDEIMLGEYITNQDINEHWRGFEGHQVLLTYLDGNAFQLLFGQGFGALVDLGIYIKLGEEEMRLIPHFHNGYLYILFKFGIVGLILYILFLFKMFFYNKIGYIKFKNIMQADVVLIRSLVVVIAFTTLVITGPFNKSLLDPSIFTLAVLIAYRDKIGIAG